MAARTERAAAAAAGEARPRYRWVMLGLLFALYLCFGLISRAPGPLVGAIVADLQITYGEMGGVLGAWQLSYIVFALLAGLGMDRFGLRRVLLFGALVIAASGLLRAAAPNFAFLFLAVALFGVGGPMISVGAPKLIATWFRGSERGTAAGIYSTGSQIGGILALAATNAVVLPLTGNWRAALAVYGALALVAAIVWGALARDPTAAAAPAERKSGSARALLRLPTIRASLVIALATFLTAHGVNNWLPQILVTRGYSPAEAGIWSALPQAAGIASVLWLGRIAPVGARRRAIIAFLILSAATTLLLGVASGGPFVVTLLLNGVARSLLTPLVLLVIMETPGVGAAAMGAAGGLYFTTGEVGGFAGPFLVGYLADLTGGFLAGLAILAAGNLLMLAPAALLKERRPEARADPALLH